MRPKIGRRHLVNALTVIAALIAMLAAISSSALAQQGGEFNPKLITPHQGSSEGVLELPTTPRQTVPGNLPSLVPQPGQNLEIPSHELRSQAGYAQVTLTVTDPSGAYVTGLKQDDVKLWVDDRPEPIQFFRSDTKAPVSVGIVVDTSGSMNVKMQQARAAIAQFLRDLNDRDDVFLAAFNDRPFLLQPFTPDHSQVLYRLTLLQAFNAGTALFDGIRVSLQMVERGRYDKKALLVITDGMDNRSQSSLEQVVAQARRAGVLVYSIGIGDPNASSIPFGLTIGPFSLGGGEEQVDAKTLQALSTETGAKTFIVRAVGDGEALRTACSSISGELRQQYTVGFVAPDADRGGYRGVRVEVPGHPDDAVRVRKGVTIGGGRTESASADPAAH